eukprot:NODE_8175_length_718_cov_276.045378_g7923_i0.p1 GENE.NODE_8175_length_718_cov_276.045378_g7923_i0~~NODE_8175_length_718_cov_276.045378_g7923_i0.p1  ORF type:complete len:172 (+),score=28.80 NODE_8175_length_718_cov_276.045378_g7923_i0:66-581(+)
MGGGGSEAEPLFNGYGVIRSIKNIRVGKRLALGAEQPHIFIKGAPLHPWSMYTSKGDPLFGRGTQLARNFMRKQIFLQAGIFSASAGLILFYISSGPQAKTMTRQWKQNEQSFKYPIEELPDQIIPPDCDKDPNAPHWVYVEKLGTQKARVMDYTTTLRQFNFEIAKRKDN